jgi:hypothetical protein
MEASGQIPVYPPSSLLRYPLEAGSSSKFGMHNNKISYCAPQSAYACDINPFVKVH